VCVSVSCVHVLFILFVCVSVSCVHVLFILFVCVSVSCVHVLFTLFVCVSVSCVDYRTRSNMGSVLLEGGTVSPSWAPGFIPGFCGVRVAHLF
jgi:hypothetical protein